MFDTCIAMETTKRVSREHNGRAFVVDNPKNCEIGVIQIDGCVIDDQSKRIDWAVALPENKRLNSGLRSLKLIELKRSNVLKAFEQMQATIDHVALHDVRGKIDECFIVSQIKPAVLSTVQNAILKFELRHNVRIRAVPKAAIPANG